MQYNGICYYCIYLLKKDLKDDNMIDFINEQLLKAIHYLIILLFRSIKAFL